MEFSKLRRLLQDVEVDRVIEAGRLAILLMDMSKVLVDLSMPPIPGIPRDPRTVGDLLGAIDFMLEHLRETYATVHSP
jgi:hypothetical protein